MLVLDTVESNDVTQFGRALFAKHREGLDSFETAAQRSVKAVYDEFRQPDGSSQFALVRIFRFCAYDELHHDLQPLADPVDPPAWMALMATMGDEPAWCDRHQSAGHKVVPAGADVTPMLKAVFNQLKFRPGREVSTVELMPVSEAAAYFHVPQAQGSEHIPAQDEFVVPHQIQSVVGIGSPFISGASYIGLAFSKAPIDASSADKFSQVSPFISTLLALYDPIKLWAD
jgi:hypothetical protein